MLEPYSENVKKAIQDFLLSASQGNIEDFLESLKIDMLSKGVPQVDVSNERSWTALMFAARNGHSGIVRELLKRGCNIHKINSNGQTATDIADFWLHSKISKDLSTSSQQTVLPDLCQNPLEKASYRRIDAAWLESAMKHPSSVFIVFSSLAPLVSVVDTDASTSHGKGFEILYKLARLDFTKVLNLDVCLEKCIFLGLETKETSNYESLDVRCGWFSVETKLDISQIVKVIPNVIGLPLFSGLLQLTKSEAAIVSQARSLLAWHDRNQFCPTCGHPSESVDAGYRRKCSNNNCKSNKGIYNTCYPRTDPSIIIAVSSVDNKHLLLGQNKLRHSKTMWSVLAGFVEPGENIEEACRREVYEETKVQVGSVKYYSSQPWPMPNSLMIGCHGQALNRFIKADEAEIMQARWFDGLEVEQMFACQHPSAFTLPPVQTIAHQLIYHWLNFIRVQ